MNGNPGAEPTLADHLNSFRRRWALITVLTGIGMAFGTFQSATATEHYTATAQVFAPATAIHSGLKRQPGQRAPRDVTVDTEVQLLYSNSVIGRVASTIGVSPTAARQEVTVTVPPNTQILTIHVRASTRKKALAGANVATDAYLALRQQIIAGARQRHLEALQSRISVLQSRLDGLSGAAVPRNSRSGAYRRMISRQINRLEQQVSALQWQSVSSGEVVRAATAPSRPDRGNGEIPVVSYAAIGLLAGVAMGKYRDRALSHVPRDHPFPAT